AQPDYLSLNGLLFLQLIYGFAHIHHLHRKNPFQYAASGCRTITAGTMHYHWLIGRDFFGSFPQFRQRNGNVIVKKAFGSGFATVADIDDGKVILSGRKAFSVKSFANSPTLEILHKSACNIELIA